jgi:hypothetical protein
MSWNGGMFNFMLGIDESKEFYSAIKVNGNKSKLHSQRN